MLFYNLPPYRKLQRTKKYSTKEFLADIFKMWLLITLTYCTQLKGLREIFKKVLLDLLIKVLAIQENLQKSDKIT